MKKKKKKSVVENKLFTNKNNALINSSMATSYDNIDKAMLNSFNENLLKPIEKIEEPCKLNGLNGSSSHFNRLDDNKNLKNHNGIQNGDSLGNELNSDEEDDFCDTSDHINEQAS